MHACTFQPNVPRARQAFAAGAAAAATWVAVATGNDSGLKSHRDGSDSDGDGAGSGGGGNGVGEGGGGGSPDSARAAGGCRLSGTASSKVGTVTSSKKGLDGMAVAQRLFEEAGRLDERRFEGQERKRMWEEEVYARTCTFEVMMKRGRSPKSYLASAHVLYPWYVTDGARVLGFLFVDLSWRREVSQPATNNEYLDQLVIRSSALVGAS